MATIYQKLTKKMKKKRDYVMKEFHKDKLYNGGTGKIVHNPKIALAIAYSEGRKKRLKK